MPIQILFGINNGRLEVLRIDIFVITAVSKKDNMFYRYRIDCLPLHFQDQKQTQ